MRSVAVLLACVGVLALGCRTLPAPPPPSAPPRESGQSERWLALREQGVVVLSRQGETAPEWLLEELLAGLQALPPAARRFPGGELLLDLRDEPSPFGMGDGSEARPDWLDGSRRFVLYRYVDSEEPRANYRLERLTAEERERLWRRRAMVHAVLRRWDERLRWSQRAAWSRITGWRQLGQELLAPAEHALNSYAWAYSRKRGMDSASLDLVTFAEEALVPPEALREDALPVDDQVRCQEFSKGRYLEGLLRALGGQARGTPATAEERGPGCPAFERWADLGSLSHFEVLLSAPSGERPQSMFGHLILRPVYRQGPERLGAYDPVVEIAAITGFTENIATFVGRGVLGGYLNAYDIVSMGTIRTEHVDRDGRDLRRFRLELSAAERARLMERLWELERRGYYPYRFFGNNCASYLAFALDGVVEPERVMEVGGLVVLPTGVLDALSRPESALSTRDPEDFLSHGARALEAEREQDAWVAELAQRLPELAGDWAAYRTQSRSPNLEDRRKAYDGLSALAARTLDRAPDARLRELVVGIVDGSVRIERYAVERSEETVRRVENNRLLPPKGFQLPSTDELVTARQARYEREVGHDRLAEDLARHVRFIELLESIPKRPATANEEATLRTAARARETFLGVTKLYGDLYDLASVAPPKSEPPTSLTWDRVRSGLGRWAVGPGVLAQGAATTPVLVLKTSFLNERLGEQRQNGLDPLTELRLLDGTLHWTTEAFIPRVARVELTVARMRTMPRAPRVARQSVFDWLGMGAEYAYIRKEDGLTEHRASAEVSVPLYATPRYERHAVLSLGPAALAEGELLPVMAGVGSRAGLSGRVAGRGFALRADASWMPLWSVWGGTGWTHHLRGQAAVEVPLPARGLQLALALNADWRMRREGVDR
ncbi:MAG TPA: DUF4105 domain-containing protein, partial [Longimicrobium sp.]|nr:DUF4105 domain-containing protein [Longimicrobium sp.]